jgi:hypothetical protein
MRTPMLMYQHQCYQQDDAPMLTPGRDRRLVDAHIPDAWDVVSGCCCGSQYHAVGCKPPYPTLRSCGVLHADMHFHP